MQLEDLVRKAGALKRDDASSKNGGMNLPQGRDILGGGVSRMSRIGIILTSLERA